MGNPKLILGSVSIAAILAVMPTGAAAQGAADNGDSDEPTKVEDIITVIGVRESLAQSLEVKRNADTIGEAITADDIGALPALDIGEALQVIPGVQVNRENDDGNYRSSEISLRGLPGSFTNVTANGQQFATPSGSVLPEQGEPNPFGAFDSGVFDGVWVNKTSRADLVEGGIAGTVDQRLARALSKPDGQLVVRFDGRYEDLSEDYSPGYFVTGTKHLIEDKLGLTFRLASAKESFRRDVVNITRYNPLGRQFAGLADWKAENGVPADADVVFPSDIRQYSELREGWRTSFVGGAEFRPTNSLKFGADVLYTDRDLDASTEIFLMVARPNNAVITPTSDPFVAFTDPQTGEDTYAISSYDFENVNYNEGIRPGSLKQTAQGIFLNGEYEADGWLIDSSISYSEADFERVGSNIQTQVTSSGGAGNGVTGSFDSGMGDIGNYVFDINVNTNLDQPFNISGTPYDDNFVTGADGTRFFATGNDVVRRRTDTGFNLNFARDLDLGFIKDVKFGTRLSESTTESYIYTLSVAGLSYDGILNDLFATPTAIKQGNFFGSEAPGALRDNWLTISPGAVRKALLANGLDNPTGLPVSLSGYLYRTLPDQTTLLGLDTFVDSEIQTSALYGLANIETQVAGKDVWGNVGVRYVETDIEGQGFSLINGSYVPETAESSYSNVLPSANIAVEIFEDVILRAAYSESITRPDPAGFTPGRSVEEINTEESQRVDVALPASDLEAYSSTNYDISIEWYNRPGSAVTLAFYRKDVESYFDRRNICPQDGGGLGFGTLTLNNIGGGISTCIIDAPFDPGDGSTVQREIRISEVVNLDQTIELTGIELGIQQNLDFLPGFWGGFGMQANAAFLDVSGDDENGDPLTVPRISDESYNLVGYWENDTFSTRLAYNWRSDYYLEGGNSFIGFEDRQVKARGQLDLIMRYNVNEHLSFNFRGFNLTDTLYEEYQSQNDNLPRLTAYDGRIYSLGATYEF